MKNSITKVEHVLVKESDRWIYIEWSGDDVWAINSWQGANNYEEFKCYANKPLQPLTEYYLFDRVNASDDSYKNISVINEAIDKFYGTV